MNQEKFKLDIADVLKRHGMLGTEQPSFVNIVMTAEDLEVEVEY